MADSHDDMIMQFCELTGTSASKATQCLESCQWDLSMAVSVYFSQGDDDATSAAGSSSQAARAVPEPEYTGPRTLDGQPAPHSAFPSSSSSSKKPAKKKGLATLSSLGGGHDHDHDHDDDDDDEEEDDLNDRRGPRDLFAGGEKSGLAVQDPSRNAADPQNVIKDILAKAKANAKRATSEEASSPGPSRSSNFRGSGVTVGGEGTESRTIADAQVPRTPRGEELPVVTRTLHLWRDGFSIEDGPLRRYDDPQHAMDLQMIRTGRAPLHLMDVEHGQRCDVRLQQHEEDWHQLPRIYRPFGGQGRRLGSPMPGDGSSASVPLQHATAPAASSSTPAAAPAPVADVDSSQPSVAIRFQMPDGSRLPARFNLTHTIGDLYQFARSASADTRDRPFMIQSTFPSKEYTDHSQKLEEIDAFKRGGIAVVKWA
ncbi:UBX domain-containing protein 1 [Cytospora mali]|uniref:UBX domain-containing protein 1 n=1 Tax=Cytospora mali TaxID=578113 RepID=A0A194W5F4_CYTMA|nr:UBX domain-containing protein 1 [Valsa mali]